METLLVCCVVLVGYPIELRLPLVDVPEKADLKLAHSVWLVIIVIIIVSTWKSYLECAKFLLSY
jgi:hypothetical protein